MNDYTATAVRSDGWWIVQCDQHPGALSQVRRLDQAAEAHREAIAFVAGVPSAQVRVVVRPEVPAQVRDDLAEADELLLRAERSETEARRKRRAAAARLAADGLPLRDIGVLLGISHQRVSQLLDTRSRRSA